LSFHYGLKGAGDVEEKNDVGKNKILSFKERALSCDDDDDDDDGDDDDGDDSDWVCYCNVNLV
jgi:hypothetical protein